LATADGGDVLPVGRTERVLLARFFLVIFSIIYNFISDVERVRPFMAERAEELIQAQPPDLCSEIHYVKLGYPHRKITFNKCLNQTWLQSTFEVKLISY
jgi:hypothetical protein